MEAARYAFTHHTEFETTTFADSYNNHYIFYAWVNKIPPQEVQQYHQDRPEKNAFGSVDLTVVSAGRFYCLLQTPRQLIITPHSDPDIAPQQVIRHYNRFYEGEPFYFVYESDLVPTDARAKVSAECQKELLLKGQ